MADQTPSRLLLWRVGSERYGVPLALVREVLPALPPTRVPGAPEVVRGLVNLRGSMLMVLDGRLLLGAEAVRPGESLLVLELGGRRVGLEVDEVEDLQDGTGGDIWEGGDGILVPDLAHLVEPVFAGAGSR